MNNFKRRYINRISHRLSGISLSGVHDSFLINTEILELKKGQQILVLLHNSSSKLNSLSFTASSAQIINTNLCLKDDKAVLFADIYINKLKRTVCLSTTDLYSFIPPEPKPAPKPPIKRPQYILQVNNVTRNRRGRLICYTNKGEYKLRHSSRHIPR